MREHKQPQGNLGAGCRLRHGESQDVPYVRSCATELAALEVATGLTQGRT